MSVASFYNWPTLLDGDLIVNGSMAESVHALLIEQAIFNLCGWGHQYAGMMLSDVDAGRTMAAGATLTLPLRLLPYVRHLSVWVGCVALEASGGQIAFTCSVSGSGTATIELPAYAADGSDEVSIMGPFQVGDVGDGSATAAGLVQITLTNTGTTSIRLWSIKLAADHNEELEP